MPHRLSHIFGYLDIGAITAAFGVLVGISGSQAASQGTFLAGLGTFLYLVARGVKFIAESGKIRAEAKVIMTFSDPDVYRMLERIKCWDEDCPTRKIFRPKSNDSAS
ncbi:MAG: hypothetical protein HGB04_04040 [Chlorobiaceae bacterium]|nr:hypothetical protein [Chlorobiaceae bacterium]